MSIDRMAAVGIKNEKKKQRNNVNQTYSLFILPYIRFIYVVHRAIHSIDWAFFVLLRKRSPVLFSILILSLLFYFIYFFYLSSLSACLPLLSFLFFFLFFSFIWKLNPSTRCAAENLTLFDYSCCCCCLLTFAISLSVEIRVLSWKPISSYHIFDFIFYHSHKNDYISIDEIV